MLMGVTQTQCVLTLAPQGATFSVAYSGPHHNHPLPHDHYCVPIEYFSRWFSLALLPWVCSVKAWNELALFNYSMSQSCSFSSAIYTPSFGPQQGMLLYSRLSQSSALSSILMLLLPSYQAAIITRDAHWTLSNLKDCPSQGYLRTK